MLSTLPLWLIIVIIFDAIIKGFALWRAGRQNQNWWFFWMFVLNTAGILPIIYLIFFQKKR